PRPDNQKGTTGRPIRRRTCGPPRSVRRCLPPALPPLRELRPLVDVRRRAANVVHHERAAPDEQRDQPDGPRAHQGERDHGHDDRARDHHAEHVQPERNRNDEPRSHDGPPLVVGAARLPRGLPAPPEPTRPLLPASQSSSPSWPVLKPGRTRRPRRSPSGPPRRTSTGRRSTATPPT